MGGPGEPNIDTFRAHFMTLSPGPLRGSKWIQNGIKLEPKWDQNGTQIQNNGAKLDTYCIEKRIRHQFDLFVFAYLFVLLPRNDNVSGATKHNEVARAMERVIILYVAP